MPNVSRNLIKHFLRLFVYTVIPSLSLSLPFLLPLSLPLPLSPHSNLPHNMHPVCPCEPAACWPIDFTTCSDVCVCECVGEEGEQESSRSWRRLLTYFNNYLPKALVSLQFRFPSPQLHPEFIPHIKTSVKCLHPVRSFVCSLSPSVVRLSVPLNCPRGINICMPANICHLLCK